jgi:hypothetical protein
MKVKKLTRYSLVVMAPGDPEKELIRLVADKPFRGFRKGDEVAPRRWPTGKDAREDTLAGMVLRIVRVRHVICETDGLIDHLVCLTTEDAGEPTPR